MITVGSIRLTYRSSKAIIIPVAQKMILSFIMASEIRYLFAVSYAKSTLLSEVPLGVSIGMFCQNQKKKNSACWAIFCLKTTDPTSVPNDTIVYSGSAGFPSRCPSF